MCRFQVYKSWGHLYSVSRRTSGSEHQLDLILVLSIITSSPPPLTVVFIISYLGIILYLLGHRSLVNFLFPARLPFQKVHIRVENPIFQMQHLMILLLL
jgi:hypothetical protein